MNPSKFTFLLLLAALAPKLPAVALPSIEPVAAPNSSAGVLPDAAYDEFVKQFNQARKINATAEMSKLVRTMTEPAIFYIMATAEGISNQSSEELELRMAALRVAWKDSMETGFPTRMYEYFSLLDTNIKAERSRLKSRYTKVQRKYVDNLEKKDSSTFALLALQLKTIAESFEILGDKYHASQSWILYGSCNRDDMRSDGADPYATCLGYKRAYQLREEIELKDRFWVDSKRMYDSLAQQGFDREKPKEGEAGPGGPAAGPAGAASSGPAITAPMEFEVVEDLFAFQRPMYYADDYYQAWNSVYLKEKGTTGTFSSLDKLSPTAHRVGANRVSLDLDGDGVGDFEIPLTGKWEPVEFEIGAGAEKRKWACLTTIGTVQEYFQQIQVNLQPSDEFFQLYYVPAASMVGEIDGVSVRVFDDNGDGIYGSPPKLWQHRGLKSGDMQPEFDSISVDGAKRAVPWSEYLEIGDQWYQLSSVNAGTELGATPVDLETGSLRLKFKGGKPAWLILSGKGRLAEAYFDISKGKVEVPVGTYELVYGELRKGKKRQMVKAVILPGTATPSWTVAAGETVDVELGSPFGFEFSFEVSGVQVTLSGPSVVVTGSGSERYERLWNCTPRPEVSWRPAGTKRGSKGRAMKIVLDQDKLFQIGWDKAWFPIDLSLDLKGKPEGVELKLFEKKNKLFGKIESGWKGQ